MCILFCTFCRAQLTLNNKIINIKYVLDYIKNDFFFKFTFYLLKINFNQTLHATYIKHARLGNIVFIK